MYLKRQFTKTRIAPTPSGYLHLGNVFSFVLTAALAKKTGAAVLLRIDDLDRERFNRAYVEDVFYTLRFMQIPWTEGPRDAMQFEDYYSQLRRLRLYKDALEQLKKSGKIYACTCSRSQLLKHNADGIYPGTCRHKELPLETENACWRVDTTQAREIAVKTPQGTIVKAALPLEIHDFVVRKKDGFPAYQLSSVIDDLYFGVDLVVRGKDLWPSTLAQIYLSTLLPANAFRDIAFYHHPLLTDDMERKLSKSAGDTSIRYLREQGLTNNDVYTRLANYMGAGLAFSSAEDFINTIDLPDDTF